LWSIFLDILFPFLYIQLILNRVLITYYFVPSDEQSFTRWMEEYKIFVRDTVNRYKDNVKKWELWNEPNFKEWWYPRPDSTLYGRWADAMQQEIKAADFSAQIPWGCLTLLDEGLSNSEDYIPGDRFLEDLYSLGYYLFSSIRIE